MSYVVIDSERPPYENYMIRVGFPHTVVEFDVFWEEDIEFKEEGTFVWKCAVSQRTVIYDVCFCEPNEFVTLWDYFRRFWYGPAPIQKIVMTYK